ncbi:isopentenyl-diphosphate Delta-isomerase [Georgenia sp. TF02-10]|nr:isopentenyl-diphosphate Delta-isomerase [Georgenia sp. TF02-10]
MLLTEDGQPRGTAPRATVHGPDTPLHLAFSCWLGDGAGRVLLTRRALTKRTWPGVWTNAFCGHPRPGEDVGDAVARHGRHELGLTLTGLTCVLPHFRYRATDAAGTVENEVCPVYAAVATAEPVPDPTEVAEHRWVEPAALARAVEAVPWVFSPWMVDQLDLLAAAGVALASPDPAGPPTAGPTWPAAGSSRPAAGPSRPAAVGPDAPTSPGPAGPR